VGSVGTGVVGDPDVAPDDAVLEPEDADVTVALRLGTAGVGVVAGALACPQPTSRRHSAAIVTGR